MFGKYIWGGITHIWFDWNVVRIIPSSDDVYIPNDALIMQAFCVYFDVALLVFNL